MIALYYLIENIINIYIFILIAAAIMSWLVAFDILNPHSRAVQAIRFALFRLTEPLLYPIRRILPDLGGIDISPLVLILLLWFINDLLREVFFRASAVSL